MRSFELVGGGSAKFWQVERDGSVVSVRFGRLGTTGQHQVKDLASEAAAIAHVDKLIAEKVKKGYAEVAPAAGSAPASASVPAAGRASAAGGSAPVATGSASASAGLVVGVAPASAGAVSASAGVASAVPGSVAVPSAAPEPAEVVALPDEDVFEPPASWRRSFVPRRGGAAGPALPTGSAGRDGARRTLREQEKAIDQVLGHLASDAEIAADARSAMRSLRDGDGGEGSPIGAAALVGAVAWAFQSGNGERAQAFADAWVASRGVVFAATAAVELAGLFIGNHQGHSASAVGAHIRRLRDDDHHQFWLPPYLALFPARVRAHLAVAADDDYAAVRATLAGYRGGPFRQRILTSFLVPDQTRWVDEDCATVASTGSHADDLLLCAVTTTEQLEQLADKVFAYSVLQSLRTVTTLADGLGAPIGPVLARWFDQEYTDAEGKRRCLTVLSALPTDEAFGALLDRVEQKYVQPAIVEAASRFPVRALRLLAAGPAGTGAAARAAADLLRSHILAHPAAVAAALPDLPEASRERIEAIVATNVVVPDAPADRLPAVLTAPPWTTRRVAVKPVVVRDLFSDVTTAMAWQPGEREAWTDGECAYPPEWGQSIDWDKQVSQFRRGQLSSYQEAGMFLRGPEHLVRPMLERWRPRDLWYPNEWLNQFVARFEVAGLPAALRVVRESPNAASSLLPYADADVATAMADWFLRLKSARQSALSWLLRHPAVAASALIPAALDKAGAARRAAEHALLTIAGAGHRAAVDEAARRYGPEAVRGIDALMALDPLDNLPARMPMLPGWAEPALLPQVLLRDRAHALPEASVRHLCTMLALSRPGEVYAGVPIAIEVCDPRSLAEFAWALFQRWQAAGAPSKESWVLDSLGLIGDDETVRRLAPVIRAWPGEGGHSRAVAGLEVLATIGTDVALMHLHGIAEKVKFKGLKERAAAKMAEVAEQLGLRPEQLADRLVPDLGLDANGSLTLDYGPRRFVVGFDEQLKPYVADETGTRRKDLPKPGARDDEPLAGASYQRFAGLKKDVRTIAGDQIRRLEQAMVSQRRWSGAEFGTLFVAHPLLWHIVRRLVWATFDDTGALVAAFRVAEDRSLADADDDTTTLDDAAAVGVAHPLHLGDALQAWRAVFADYEILQPFPQLSREVHHLTEEERGATTLDRFKGQKVATGKVLGLERRGWRRGDPQDAGIQGWMERILPGNRAVVVSLDPGIPIGMVNEFPEQVLEDVWINNSPTGDWRPTKGRVQMGQLDAVTASELLRDLNEVVA